MGAVRMKVQTADKNITIIHRSNIIEARSSKQLIKKYVSGFQYERTGKIHILFIYFFTEESITMDYVLVF